MCPDYSIATAYRQPSPGLFLNRRPVARVPVQAQKSVDLWWSQSSDSVKQVHVYIAAYRLSQFVVFCVAR